MSQDFLYYWDNFLAVGERFFSPYLIYFGGSAVNMVAVIGLSVLVLHVLAAWFIWGRDKRRGVVVVQYEPPKGLSPAECAMITGMRTAGRAFAASLIQMAVAGYWKLGKAQGKYHVQLLNEEAPLFHCEKMIGGVMFSRGRRHAEFSAGGGSIVSVARDRLLFELKRIEHRYFHRHEGTVRFCNWLVITTIFAIGLTAGLSWDMHVLQLLLFVTVWLLIGFLQVLVYGPEEANRVFGSVRWIGAANILLLIGLLFIGARFVDVPWQTYAVLVLSAPIMLVFDHLVRAPTNRGRALMDEIDGFALYLKTAEQDRMNFHNPPDKTPELYEKYLPYAVALDVEHAWAAQFGKKAAVTGFMNELTESQTNLKILLGSFSPAFLLVGRARHAEFGKLASEKMIRGHGERPQRNPWQVLRPKRRRQRAELAVDAVDILIEWWGD